MKNVVVIDTSIAIKWVLQEPDTPSAKRLLFQWYAQKTQILAPALLSYEVANVLYQQVRKGNITLASAQEALETILLTGIHLDFSHDPLLARRALELADQFKLPATYDTHFLALAERENCVLWTADTRLWKAMQGTYDWVRSLNDYPAKDFS